MATTVARLEAVLSADTDKFDRQMDHSHSKLKSVGKGAFLAAGVLGGALAIGAKKAIDASSNLNESINAVNVVFGKAGKQIHDFSKKAAREAGLSMRELNELVTPLGAAFTNMGDSQDVAAKKSIALAKRAADMASVFNVDVKDALGAIQAGLRGEADPLERFGVGLNAAAVQTQALKMGLAKTKEELTDSDKAQARYALLMKQTDKVSGDFKNTSGGLANQQRILKAELENLEANVGNFLIPIVTKAVVWIGDHWPAAVIKIKEVWEKVKPSLHSLMETAKDVVETIRKHWGTIGPILQTVVNIFKNAVAQIINIFQLFAAIFRGDWDRVWKEVKQIVGTALHQIGLLLSLWKDTVFAAAKAIGKAILEGAWAGIKSLAGWFEDKITGLFHSVIDWVKGALGIHSPSSVFHEIGVNMIKGMVNGVGSMGGFLKDAVVKLAKSIPHRIAGVFTGGGGNSNRGEGLQPKVLRALDYARQMGWAGQVTSGFRTYAEQAALYQRYLAGGPLAARPGTSSHETGSAVDVTDYDRFSQIMAGAPSSAQLFNYLGARDPVHFSLSGYDTGGWLPRGLSLAYNGTGRPERVLGPGESGTTIFNFPNYVGSRSELMSWLQNASQQFKNQNGRTAFG